MLLLGSLNIADFLVEYNGDAKNLTKWEQSAIACVVGGNNDKFLKTSSLFLQFNSHVIDVMYEQYPAFQTMWTETLRKTIVEGDP